MSEERMPMIRLATLKRLEKKDGSGSYFIGRMGGVKVLMFRDTKAEGAGEQWNLLIQEQSQEERERARAYFEGKRQQEQSPAPAKAKPSPNQDLNDEVPF